MSFCEISKGGRARQVFVVWNLWKCEALLRKCWERKFVKNWYVYVCVSVYMYKREGDLVLPATDSRKFGEEVCDIYPMTYTYQFVTNFHSKFPDVSGG